jgi:transcriptional regulator with XRE-family HTH domain
MPPPDDNAARVPLGPVGGYVIQNLTEIRAARRLTYKQLADQLEQLGRPIPTLGLSRIEKGNRRVDVDDLVALAIALGVNPNALLLPRDHKPEQAVDLAARRASVPAAVAWRWADGHMPLPRHDEITQAEQSDFEKYARPTASGYELTEVVKDEPAASGFPHLILRGIPPKPDEDWRAEMTQRVEDLERRLREERARNGHHGEEEQ